MKPDKVVGTRSIASLQLPARQEHCSPIKEDNIGKRYTELDACRGSAESKWWNSSPTASCGSAKSKCCNSGGAACREAREIYEICEIYEVW